MAARTNSVKAYGCKVSNYYWNQASLDKKDGI